MPVALFGALFGALKLALLLLLSLPFIVADYAYGLVVKPTQIALASTTPYLPRNRIKCTIRIS